MRGINLEVPYGQMILNDEKRLVVSSEAIPWEERELYLIEDNKVIGIVTLSNERGPYEASTIRTVLEEFHKLSDEDWTKRTMADKVFTFMVEDIQPFNEVVEHPAEGFWIDDINLNLESPDETAKMFTLKELKSIIRDLQNRDLEAVYLTKKIELVELMQERVRRGMNGGT